MISECEDYTDMGHFAQSQLAWLRQFIPLRSGGPRHGNGPGCVRRETMRQRHGEEPPADEIHYYLSSSQADAAELGRLIRNHWSVENQCHHLLDVTYHEDHCQVRDKAAAHNLTLMRELSTKVLKSSPLKGSIRSKCKRCCLDPAFRTALTQNIFHGFGA